MRQQKISGSLLAEGKGGMTCLLMRGKGEKKKTHNYHVGPQIQVWTKRSEVDSDLANEQNVNFK